MRQKNREKLSFGFPVGSKGKHRKKKLVRGMHRKKRILNYTFCTIYTCTTPTLFAHTVHIESHYKKTERLSFKAAVFHLNYLNQGSPFYSISLTEIAPEFLHHAFVDITAYGFQAMLTGRIQNHLEHLQLAMHPPSFS